MRRIIQKYQEGGVVQPGPTVVTGIPAGGNAAAAIQSYLSGTSAGPLSYSTTTSGDANQTRLDYHAAAKKLRDDREAAAKAVADAEAGIVSTVADSVGNDSDSTQFAIDLHNRSHFPTEDDGSYIGRDDGLLGDSTSNSFTSGGGADGFGNYGVLGDIGGAIGDALNITNYDGSQDGKPSGNAGGWENSGWNPKNWNNGGDVASDIQRYNNGSAGGVSIAKSGNEEEIRQRQLMQSPLPQVQASPLSNIGSKLAMGAIDKGIGSAASSMMAKEGLMGTLGTALGSSATAGAAGTGMMAALGPIGIGIGLGKLFGLFNDGGKVPCSCGKTTSCKCAKEIKSPLSGE